MDIQTLVDKVPVEGQFSLEGIDFLNNGKQYLTFFLADEQYAVDILCVEEIRSWENPTKIPNAPVYVKGLINMRGSIVPIIDLRIKFGFRDVCYLNTTVIIVLTIEFEDQTRTIGFVVDAVADVLNAKNEEIKVAPPFGHSIAQKYIAGLINVGNSIVTLINVLALDVMIRHE